MRSHVSIAAGIVVASAAWSATQAATLVAHYEFENNANDSAGTANNGTVQGGTATYVPGQVGNAISLDGIDDFVSIADAADLDLTGSFTLAAWIRPASNPTSGTRGIISKWDNLATGDHRSYSMALSSTGLVTGLVDADGGFTAGQGRSSTGTVPLNEWTHVAFVYVAGSPNSLKLYIDGQLDSTHTNDQTAVFSGNAPLWIGAHFAATEPKFHGLIDDARVYNGALSDTEVAALVPEPASLSLIALGTLAIARRRTR
jgi:hypothetical protein